MQYSSHVENYSDPFLSHAVTMTVNPPYVQLLSCIQKIIFPHSYPSSLGPPPCLLPLPQVSLSLVVGGGQHVQCQLELSILQCLVLYICSVQCYCIAQHLLQTRLSVKKRNEQKCDDKSLRVDLTLCPLNSTVVAAVGVVVASPLGFMCSYLNKVCQVWVSSYEKELKKN